MRGVRNDVPWRGQGDVMRTRFSENGKGDARRPAQPAHTIPCGDRHHFDRSGKCYRCPAVREDSHMESTHAH